MDVNEFTNIASEHRIRCSWHLMALFHCMENIVLHDAIEEPFLSKCFHKEPFCVTKAYLW